MEGEGQVRTQPSPALGRQTDGQTGREVLEEVQWAVSVAEACRKLDGWLVPLVHKRTRPVPSDARDAVHATPGTAVPGFIP